MHSSRRNDKLYMHAHADLYHDALMVSKLFTYTKSDPKIFGTEKARKT